MNTAYDRWLTRESTTRECTCGTRRAPCYLCRVQEGILRDIDADCADTVARHGVASVGIYDYDLERTSECSDLDELKAILAAMVEDGTLVREPGIGCYRRAETVMPTEEEMETMGARMVAEIDAAMAGAA